MNINSFIGEISNENWLQILNMNNGNDVVLDQFHKFYKYKFSFCFQVKII